MSARNMSRPTGLTGLRQCVSRRFAGIHTTAARSAWPESSRPPSKYGAIP
jgi:hypothetical protein